MVMKFGDDSVGVEVPAGRPALTLSLVAPVALSLVVGLAEALRSPLGVSAAGMSVACGESDPPRPEGPSSPPLAVEATGASDSGAATVLSTVLSTAVTGVTAEGGFTSLGSRFCATTCLPRRPITTTSVRRATMLVVVWSGVNGSMLCRRSHVRWDGGSGREVEGGAR